MVQKKHPPHMQWILEVLLHARVQLVQPTHEKEHLPSDRRGLDGFSVETVLPRGLSREFGGHRPVPGALGITDTIGLSFEPTEIGVGATGRSRTLLSGDHVPHGRAHHFL